jgi:hypothetical protein
MYSDRTIPVEEVYLNLDHISCTRLVKFHMLYMEIDNQHIESPAKIVQWGKHQSIDGSKIFM